MFVRAENYMSPPCGGKTLGVCEEVLMMAAPPGQEESALKCDMVSERNPLTVHPVVELLGFPDGDVNRGDRLVFRSVEEKLVADLEDKLNACFGHDQAESELVDGVNARTEDCGLKNDVIWNILTENYGNVMPVDWNQSHTRSLHLPVLNIEDRTREDNVTLDVSDDEELREQMDMHLIIKSCINAEPFLTAEQVIEEIEEMMHIEQNPIQSNLIYRFSSHNLEERVRNLSVAELNELLEEVEMAVHQYSEELVRHLALRDELDFEKEVMNSFISVLIDVQNLQKEQKDLKKKRKVKNDVREENGRLQRLSINHFSMERISTAIQNGFRQTFGSMGGEKQYLTTVIPYEKKNMPPSVSDLQVLTKILEAMRDDSDKVPNLLTDYILKALSGLAFVSSGLRIERKRMTQTAYGRNLARLDTKLQDDVDVSVSIALPLLIGEVTYFHNMKDVQMDAVTVNVTVNVHFYFSYPVYTSA